MYWTHSHFSRACTLQVSREPSTTLLLSSVLWTCRPAFLSCSTASGRRSSYSRLRITVTSQTSASRGMGGFYSESLDKWTHDSMKPSPQPPPGVPLVITHFV